MINFLLNEGFQLIYMVLLTLTFVVLTGIITQKKAFLARRKEGAISISAKTDQWYSFAKKYKRKRSIPVVVVLLLGLAFYFGSVTMVYMVAIFVIWNNFQTYIPQLYTVTKEGIYKYEPFNPIPNHSFVSWKEIEDVILFKNNELMILTFGHNGVVPAGVYYHIDKETSDTIDKWLSKEKVSFRRSNMLSDEYNPKKNIFIQ